MTFNFYNDPGHGWVEVTTADAADVGLHAQDFTRYSYRRGNTLYLEEDCDASKFVAAYERKHGRRPKFRDVYQHVTFIRNLPAIHN